jgi:hypothetical protein
MIVPQPTDAQLRAAHVVALFDPNRPEFHRVIVDQPGSLARTAVEFNVIDIPVNSGDRAEIERWVNHVQAVRSSAG